MSNDAQDRDDWKQRMQDYLFRDCTFSNYSNSLIASELDFLDRCAIAAMHGINAGDGGKHFSADQIVIWAWETADLMLVERTKRRANRGK